jgi:hypothetical protein
MSIETAKSPPGLNPVAALLAASPVVLAPMEDVTDAPFRRICRALGAAVCVTEFVGVEQILSDSRLARRRATLADDDQPTAIQIYGADPDLLLAAARLVTLARPAFVDLNCGCWVPSVVGRNAGAGWLRDPVAMVEMARRISSVPRVPASLSQARRMAARPDLPDDPGRACGGRTRSACSRSGLGSAWVIPALGRDRLTPARAARRSCGDPAPARR